MKVLKHAQQKNVMVNTAFYNIYMLNELLKSKTIFYNEKTCHDSSRVENYDEITDMDGYTFRLFLINVKELKVVCEDGNYQTVAILHTGEKIYVEI